MNKLKTLLSLINKRIFINIVLFISIAGLYVIALITINKMKTMNIELSNELNNQKQITEMQTKEISDYKEIISNNEISISDLEKQLQSASEKNVEMENTIKELRAELEKKNNTFLGEFKVSFYTPTDGSITGTTATGNKAIPNHTVAVDPNVIPLGTRLYIENFGEVIADDTGGAIKGNKLDYCVATTSEAYSNGVQYLKVWIIE